jgi:alpha-tubulin suppressor-like RCC1 family protein
MHGKSYALVVAVLALLTLVGLSDAGAATIAAGSNFTVALKSDGSLWAWGANGSGQLGIGSTTSAMTPTEQTGTTITNWTAVAAGSDFTVAIASDGTLWAWGDDTNSRLGDGGTANQTSPVQISSSVWLAVSAGSNFAVAIRSDGTLCAWGSNASGQLGVLPSTVGSEPTPTPIDSVTTWSAVAAGSDFVVALQSNGTMWAWGDNSIGQVGSGVASSTPSLPVQIGTDRTWKAVAAGSSFAVAIALDGTLWTWGSNGSGQLGNGTSSGVTTTPTQVGSGTTWSAVAAGSDFAVALQSNGSLWAWGDNGSGQLGIGPGAPASEATPTALTTSTTWSAVAAGSDFAVAVASDGGLWTWGDNSSYELGDGTTTSQSAPESIMSGFNVRPTVTSTVPADGATDVEIDSTIQVTFSEAMDPTSLTTATFVFSPAVAGAVVYDPSTFTATFIPSGNMPSQTAFTATITTGVRDVNGNNMAANYTWSFTTETKKPRCFIATAAYGSSLDYHVAALRAFRDNYLLTNRAGRSFVDFYYRYSPPLARIIARHPALRAMTRWALTLVVYGVMHPLVCGFIPPLSFVWIYLEKRRRRRKVRERRKA